MVNRHSWIAVSTVLLLTLLLGGCEALQSVDRGLYGVAEAVSETDRVTGQRSLSMANRSQQITQGNAVVQQLLAQEKKAGRKINGALNRTMYQRLVRVFDRIHRISHLRNERWVPVLIDRPSFNAFTTGGTYIVVHKGLMEQIKSDAELAAVVGHEIAHTVANHAFERQSHQTAAMIAGSGSARRSGYQSAFTHEAEIEADKIGILYSALAGFNPSAASGIWERQYRQEGSARGLFFHDHPVNPERAAYTRKIARAVLPYYRKGRQNPRFAELLDNNALWQKQQADAKPGEGGGVSALLGTMLGAYVQHEQTKQEEARQTRQMQIIRALEKNIRLLGEKPTGRNSWAVQMQNRNSVSLQKVVMGVLIKDRQGKVHRFISHVPGVVRPGGKFIARFKLDRLTLAQARKMQVRYYLDDALPVR